MKSLHTLMQIFSSFDEAIYIVDKNRKILYFNPIAERITGFSKDELVGKYCQNDTLNHVDNQGTKLCIKDCPLVTAIRKNIVMEHQIYLHHKEGHRVPVKVKTIPYVEDNETVGGIEVFSLVNKEKFEETYQLAKEKLNYIDPLTKVFNRYFLEELINGNYPINVYDYDILFIDADDFKQVNDQFGHLVGDELLSIISKTINLYLDENEYVIRFGGDEFIVLIKKSDKTPERSETIKNLINQSSLRNFKFYPSVSIGVYITKPNNHLKEALNNADKALYVSKSMGKNRIHIYK
ncbi:sensor domain-containing diguanylate cyclase [Acholeplasma hippikon]|uniref:Probable diguanylate cyclase YdaM n=1 Tax=Acholeplasma hippikon TaxID=264636 RepID=A0A449BIN9_9MOLU|nr:sensor domain-containing diguanylate cyclase [Acholeplasma hippikon]VEU82326.1 Probable diguanylate cyclase YdaM [Acholeplasma hippikon]